jgi:MerR family transcriptional regulator, light-induced transcriptional regulator
MNPRRENDESTTGKLGRAYAEAILSGDEVEAEIAIREAMDANLTTAEIDHEIIAPALWFVGELWHRGEISVADEHLATEISLRVLALQREARRVAGSRAGHRVVLATPGGELHAVALRMTGNLLLDAGYHVVMLGPDVPPRALAASAVRHEPDVICLSATMPGGADKLLIAIHEAQRVRPGTRFVIGGQGVTSRVRSRPGVEVCGRVTDAVEAVDALVQRADQN